MTDVPALLAGRYEVGELIGRGGMAEVHVGFDTRLGRQVAIKMLRTDLARDAAFLGRFRREAQSAAGLNHASIVAVYDSGEDHIVESGGAQVSIPYIVMEYVPGRTLRDVLNARGTLPAGEACRITEGVLDALAYSHRMGIVHRDIKPANVMLADDGTIKVMDFGIARAIADANATMTQTQAVIGTAQYLSPEQAQGQSVDARSDLYSTACMLYELLTGRPPFIGDSPVAIAYQHVGEPVTRASTLVDGIPADLDAVIEHALAKNRESRYQLATSFRSDLTSVRLGRPVSGAARTALTDGGSAAAVTTVLTPPTEVYAAQRPADPTVAMQSVPAAVARRDPNTASIPVVPPPVKEEPRRSGAAYVLVGLAAAIALAIAGFGIKMLLDSNSAPAQVTVPSVQSKPQATAEFEIKQAGLTAKVESEVSEDVPKGTVVRQDPAGGQKADKGAVVTIWVSTGPDAVVVPVLTGKTEAEARALLSDLELTVGTVNKKNDPAQEEGRIISSDPAAGDRIAVGDKVNLVIASGKVEVPNLVTFTLSDALTALAKAKLESKTEYREVGPDQVGKVVEQTPNSGTLNQGEVVTLIVGVETPPTPTPTPSPSDEPSPEPEPTPEPS